MLYIKLSYKNLNYGQNIGHCVWHAEHCTDMTETSFQKALLWTLADLKTNVLPAN